MSKVLDLGDGRGARGTTWALLIAMSLYNLADVLLPSGPLRLLLELAITRDEVLPAFEGRRAEPSGGEKEAVERKEEYRYLFYDFAVATATTEKAQGRGCRRNRFRFIRSRTLAIIITSLLLAVYFKPLPFASPSSAHHARYALLSLGKVFIGSVYRLVFNEPIDVLARHFCRKGNY
ncbi:hypothetical protein ZIOFF_046181 [Zingiber officinale]|uniref:Uncharacterized protein n=1 Tax=Zingiber officinale TaxID=94328 RepID=A0A8J5G541_ZINOF|nr:hypothetical protein ZIOFF_046181 [Zingiber officinale]